MRAGGVCACGTTTAALLTSLQCASSVLFSLVGNCFSTASTPLLPSRNSLENLGVFFLFFFTTALSSAGEIPVSSPSALSPSAQ